MPEPTSDTHVRVGIRELRMNLSGLLRQARNGTSFLVMSHNEIVAEIHPPSVANRPLRVAGGLKGKIRMADDFDALPHDLLEAMEGDDK